MLGSQRPYRACRVKGGHAATEVDRGIPTPARGGPTPAHAGRSPPHRAATIVDQHFHSGPSISLILSSLSLFLSLSLRLDDPEFLLIHSRTNFPPPPPPPVSKIIPRCYISSKLIPDNWCRFYGRLEDIENRGGTLARWFDDPSSRESSFDDGSSGSKRSGHGSARREKYKMRKGGKGRWQSIREV